jgi:DNA-directed RNA polymerase specialized sigma24 family protein
MTFDDALADVADIIKHNVRRVMNCTPARFAPRRDDLMQAGRIGAFYAWRSYKPTAGASWRTWSGLWIKAYVEREIWGPTHSRGGANAEGRRNAISLDRELTTADGETRTVADVVPDTAPSPETRVGDAEVLARVQRCLAWPARTDSRINTPVAVARSLGGMSLRDVAKLEGVSFQAVSLQVRQRLAKAREVREAA